MPNARPDPLPPGAVKMAMPISGMTVPGAPLSAPFRRPPAGPLRPGALLRWALLVAGRAPGAFALALVVSTIATVMQPLTVQTMTRLLGHLTGQGAIPAGPITALLPDSLTGLSVMLAVVAVLAIVTAIGNRLVLAWSNGRMQAQLQQLLHDRALALGPQFHARVSAPEMTQIINNFAPGVQPVLRDLLAYPVVNGIGLVFGLSLLVENLRAGAVAPATGAILLCLVIGLPLGAILLSGYLRAAFESARAAQVAFAEELANSTAQPVEVQLMRAIPQRSRALATRLGQLLRANLRASLRREIANQFQSAVPMALQAAILIYAALALTEASQIAPLIALYLLVPQVIAPLQDLAGFYASLTVTWPNIKPIGDILDAQPDVRDAPGAADVALADGSVRFDDVTFGYPPGGEPKILRNFSHHFPERGVSALIGASGSGKSSLLRLLLRLYEPDSGTIAVGGQPVGALTVDSLRRQVAVLSQFPLLIGGTIRQNLALAAPHADDQGCRGALERVGLWPALAQLSPDDPLAVPVTATAGTGVLSGGQRRLLALARGLIVKPRLLLVDEPTTGVDAESALRLAAVLRGLGREIAVIVIEHDVDFAARVADQVCCLEDGRITAAGPPETLLARGDNLFARFAAMRRRATSTAGMDIEAVPLPRAAGSKVAPPRP